MFAITLMFQMTMHVTVCATLRIVGIRISNTSRIMLHGSIMSTVKVVSSLVVVRRKSSTVLRTCRRTVLKLKAIVTRKTLMGRTIFQRIVIMVILYPAISRHGRMLQQPVCSRPIFSFSITNNCNGREHSSWLRINQDMQACLKTSGDDASKKIRVNS